MKHLMSLAFMLLAGQAFADTACDDPAFSDSLICSTSSAIAQKDPAAQQAWIACAGKCLISQYDEGTRIRFEGAEEITFPGLMFLHGQKPTTCLNSTVAFTNADGTVVEFYTLNGTLGSAKFANKFHVKDITLYPEIAFLSCDGARLIAQDIYGGDGETVMSSTNAQLISPSPGNRNWLFTSPNGRYGVEHISSDAFQGYRIFNFETEDSHNFSAQHELDHPFFGQADELALVHSANIPVTTDIYSLTSGILLLSLDRPLEGAFPFTVAADGTLKSLHPPASE